MHERLYAHITSQIPLTDEEFQFCRSIFIPKKIRRRQYLLQTGDVCRHIAFVDKGALRAYSVDAAGSEHVMQFAFENWWISDLASFLTGEPAVYTIDALEDSELFLLARTAWDPLFERIPRFDRFMRLLLQNNYIATHRRLIQTIGHSAEEKYTALVRDYPQIVSRVPQHMIASYLGITPETLSRVRRQMADTKG